MSNDHAIHLLVLISAMSISMALIPILIRMAPKLGMIDMPDARKVHAAPIPRVGGVGIVIGALVPMFVWLPWSDLMVSYLLGSLILLAFGVWDDIAELGHYVKFIGQFLAVLLVVYHGDLYVSHLPFMGLDTIGETSGKLFTVIAMVGMINAINHSDGLDGLAGGESLLSLAAIAYLALRADDIVVVLIALATIGGVFGFLRFNSHPARVFMGDGGSQFLGYTLGFLAVYLTQVSNTALSPALPALLLGLPVVDIIAVFFQRAYAGMNWFRATKNHIHHRLLEIGFRHYESVVLIYSVQAFFVVCAVLLPYQSDALLIAIYLVVTALVFGALLVAERQGWNALAIRRDSAVETLFAGLSANSGLLIVDRGLIKALLSVFVVGGALMSSDVPTDLSITAAILGLLLLARLMLGYRVWFLYLRLIVYVAVAFVAYLVEFYPPSTMDFYSNMLTGFYVILALAVVLAVRYSKDEFFRVNPLDYLVVLVVVVLGLMSENGYADIAVVAMAIQLIVAFYGAEVVIKHMKSLWNVFTISTLLSLCVVALRGVL